MCTFFGPDPGRGGGGGSFSHAGGFPASKRVYANAAGFDQGTLSRQALVRATIRIPAAARISPF